MQPRSVGRERQERGPVTAAMWESSAKADAMDCSHPGVGTQSSSMNATSGVLASVSATLRERERLLPGADTCLRTMLSAAISSTTANVTAASP